MRRHARKGAAELAESQAFVAKLRGFTQAEREAFYKACKDKIANDEEFAKFIKSVSEATPNARTLSSTETPKGKDVLPTFTGADRTKSIVLSVNKGELFTSIVEFETAIANGEKNLFYVGLHSDISPRPTGYQSHHGVNTVIMNAKYSDYVANNAPSIYMLATPNHYATFGVFTTWKSEMATLQGVTFNNVNYSLITDAQLLNLAERQFDAALVPQKVRKSYYEKWNLYKTTLTPR